MNPPRSPYLASLLHPLNLAMLALSIVAGLCSAWWLFPAGLVIWIIMFVLAAQDPELRLAQLMEARAPLAQRFQPYFNRIENSQAAIYRSLAGASPRNQSVLGPLQPKVEALVEQVYQLCLRMTESENQRVVEQANADTQKDLVKINELVSGTNDPVAKREYEQSRQALEKRLADLQGVATQLDRFEAKLTNVKQTMERVQTEIIRLQTLDPKTMAQPMAALLQTLQKEAEDLRTFEQTSS